MSAATSRTMRCAIVLAGIVMGLGASMGTACAAGATAADSSAAVRDTTRVRTTAASSTKARTPKAGATAVRRLDPTHIAGEIPVPQVLFITARDQRRFMDFHHQRYSRTSRQLADATAIPTWMAITRNPRKETAP